MKFERPEETVIRREEEKKRREFKEAKPELIEKYREQLKGLLSREAETLKKKDFPVDSACRINAQEFGEIIRKDDRERDEKYANRLEEQWRKESSPAEIQNKKTGDLLEMVKTLSINKLWFDGRLISVRTNRYDDYAHGIDNLIFDTETNQPLAAIDDTTHRLKLEDPAVEERIQKGGIVKYGIEYKDKKVTKKSVSKLPVFIISTNTEGLMTLAQDVSNNKTSPEGIRALNGIIGNILDQYQKIEDGLVEIKDKELLASYQKAGKIFGEL